MKRNARQRVALVLGNLAFGGAETQAMELARRLPEHGWSPVFLLAEKQGQLIAVAEDLGIPVFGLGAEFWRSKSSPAFWSNIASCVKRAADVCSREHCSIIHNHLFWQEPIAVPAARISSTVRAVITSRLQSGVYREGRWHYRAIQNALNPFVDAVVVNSKGLKRDTLRRERIAQNKVHVLYNGVDVERFANAKAALIREEFPELRDAECVVGLVGRLKPEKRQDLFVRALAVARREVPGLKALLVGGDFEGYKRTIDAAVAETGCANAVAFAGARADVERYIAACDFMALGSDSEGMPNVVLESMAAGKAIVSTRVFGASEIIRPGRNGLLVPIGDIDAMAGALVELARDGESRSRMGRHGQALVRHRLSNEAMVSSYARLYDSLLQARR